MAEENAPLREIHWRHVCPWLALFRAFGVALDFKKMALGGLGALAMTAGWWLLGNLFDKAAPCNQQVGAIADEVRHFPWDGQQWNAYHTSSNEAISQLLTQSEEVLTPAQRDELKVLVREKRGFSIVDELLRDPLHTLWRLGTNWRFVLKPVTELVAPFRAVFSHTSGFVATVFALVCGLWAVIVWAFFGGVITRLAAIQIAREEKLGLKEAIQFVTSKFLSYGGAPVIPLGFVAFFAFLCLVGGLISQIPWFGPLFAGVLWVLPLVAGFVMALIVIGWAVGWPLMYSTISVEGSDSFDALSRSFAYVFQRPWHYLFYILLSVVFGSLCSFFVLLFADLLVHMAQWAVAWGGGTGLDTTLKQLFYYAPEASGWRPENAGDAPTGATHLASICCAVWLYLLFMLVVGFVYSYFWSASTIIYYLLRRDVDNTEMQEVYLEGAEDEFDLPAVESGATPVVSPPANPPGTP